MSKCHIDGNHMLRIFFNTISVYKSSLSVSSISTDRFFKFCSQKQETEKFYPTGICDDPIGICDEAVGLVGVL